MSSEQDRRAGAGDQRIYMRFDKAFPVTVGSEVYGDSRAVARNISASGMFVELVDPPPLGSVVTVHFRIPGSGEDIVARAEVKHHYCLNISSEGGPTAARGVGLRFVEFVEDGARRMRSTFTRQRIIH
jgi:hypothetical protein